MMSRVRKLIAAGLTAGILASMALPVLAEESYPSGMGTDEFRYRLEDTVDDLQDDGKMAAMGMAVFTADEVLYSNVFGYTDIENKIEADEQTVFDWGPTAQMLVWTSAMQLKEQGLLDLNEDIRTYLPDDFPPFQTYETPVTMLDLMNHTGGFEELFVDTHEKSIGKALPLDQALKRHLPDQVYEPGTVTAQSDWGAALAGYIVECISGQSYAEYIRANILEPLDMDQTAVKPDLSDVEGLGMRRVRLRCYNTELAELENDYYLNVLYPSGSAVGTAADYLKFTQALIPGSQGSRKLFQKQETAEEMLSASDYYENSGLPKNSHGLWHLLQKVPVIGIKGITTGCTSLFMYEPESGIGLCVMTSVQGDTEFIGGIPDMIFGKTEDAEVRLGEYPSGRYMSANTIYTGPLKLFSYRAARISDDEILDGYWEMTEDQRKLEQPYSDYLKVEASTWLPRDMLIGWFTAAFIMGFLCLMIWIWPLPAEMKQVADELKLYDACTKAGHMLVLILTAVMMMTLQLAAQYYDSSYYSFVFPLLGVIAGLLAVLLVCNIILNFKTRNVHQSVFKKACGYVRPVLWLGVIVNVVYWQLYAGSLL